VSNTIGKKKGEHRKVDEKREKEFAESIKTEESRIDTGGMAGNPGNSGGSCCDRVEKWENRRAGGCSVERDCEK